MRIFLQSHQVFHRQSLNIVTQYAKEQRAASSIIRNFSVVSAPREYIPGRLRIKSFERKRFINIQKASLTLQH